MSEKQNCMIWGTEAIFVQEFFLGNLKHLVNSPRTAGEYFITTSVDNLVIGFDKRKKAHLTSWLVEQRWEGQRRPEVSTLTIKEYVNHRQDLPIRERADRLLEYIEQTVEFLGDRLSFSSDENTHDFMKMLAWSESTQRQEITSLMDYLKEEGYLKEILPTRTCQVTQFELTVQGYDRVNELKLRKMSERIIPRLPDDKNTMLQERDVFICHATEDKNEVAKPLAEGLCSRGYSVWYDEFTLTVGDGLLRLIDRGLAKSRFGVVIISPNFFAKKWPQDELGGLFAREVEGTKVILPVWHRITAEKVREHSPILADRLAALWEKGPEKVLDDLERAMSRETAY